MAINKSVPGIKNSEQIVLNTSFDEDFGVLAVEGLSYNPVNNTLERVSAIQGNGSFSYNVSGSTCVISQVIGAVTYSKTIDWSTNPITEGVWAI